MGLISGLFAKAHPSREKILNKGFKMAMEFGENWLQPVNSRLKDKFGFLSDEEITLYSSICKDALDDSSSFIIGRLTEIADECETIKDSEFKEEFERYFLQKFNWVNKSNIKRAYSQGMYYSWREGLTSVVK